MQHLWESKLVVILEGLTRGRIALCSEMQLARKSLQMHFDVHVCLLEKKFVMQLWQQKLLQILHYFWTPKWGLKNGPKNGARIWPPKWSPKMAPKRGTQFLFLVDLFQVKIYGTLLGATFGCHFWTPFWGPNSGTIFGSIFQPPFWGSKNGANFAKVFVVKAA